jgi:hypothetical protein
MKNCCFSSNDLQDWFFSEESLGKLTFFEAQVGKEISYPFLPPVHHVPQCQSRGHFLPTKALFRTFYCKSSYFMVIYRYDKYYVRSFDRGF